MLKNGWNLGYSIVVKEEQYFIESLEPHFNIEYIDKKTKVNIEGLKNLRLYDITIYTDSMFKRNAATQHGISKEIFNLSLNGVSYADTTIPLGGYISKSDIYTITISDYDDKPIVINGLQVRYYADEIVFEGNVGEVYTLEFGNPSVTSAPVYDIARYKHEVLKSPMGVASIGEISIITQKPRMQLDYQLIFNVTIIIVTLLLATVIFFKLKNEKKR